MSAAPPARHAVAIDLVIGLLSVIWGTTYFVIRQGLEDLPPFTAAAARFTVAAAVFACVAPAIARREGGRAPGTRLTLVLGLCNFTLSYGLVYVAETRLPSGLVSLLWGTFPVMLAGLTGFLLPEERVTARQWAGFAVGFAGIALLFATDLESIGGEGVLYGALLLLSPLVSAVGQLHVKRHGRDVSSALTTRNGLAIAAVLLSATALVVERGEPVRWTATAVGSVLYLALVGTVVAFGLYFWALRHAPATRLGVITYLTPTLALTLGTLAGGEPFHLHTLAGAALVLGSVALVMWRRRGG